MTEFWASASKWFSEKTSSPLYFTYIGFFIVWNWKFFQIIFLESADLFYSPKIEYIENTLYFHSGLTYQFVPIIDWILNFAWHLIPPAALTYFAIVYFPYIQKWALEKYLGNRFERRRMFETKQREYDEWILAQEKERTKTTKSLAVEKKTQVEEKKKIEKNVTDEERWEAEYKKQLGTLLNKGFADVLRTIYKEDGEIIDYSGSRNLGPGPLGFADANGLIEFGKGAHGDKIKLSEKGRFFAREFLKIHQIQ